MTQERMLQNRIEGLMREHHTKYGMLSIIIEKHPNTVSKRRNNPETYTVDELMKISKFYGITLEQLVRGTR